MGLFRDAGKAYKAAPEVDLGAHSDEFYLHANVKGIPSSALHCSAPLLGNVLMRALPSNRSSSRGGASRQDLRVGSRVAHPRIHRSLHTEEGQPHTEGIYIYFLPYFLLPTLSASLWMAPLLAARLGGKDPGAATVHRRPWQPRLWIPSPTPIVWVARRFLAAAKETEDPKLHMAFFISYSHEDEVTPMAGLYVSGGTRWLHKVRPCIEDASCVKQLRSCGAILVGKTNMHELGAGASGINPHYGATRNPYDINKISGGSSSGSAAAVCAGLCPVALGVDGGGSVRIPAALCGVVGFKPTSGRISNSGILPLNWTVGMPGILAATVEDALIT
ncbi:hypothetical protein BHM03_00020694 [Ensete ventricosum]|nr:hypothetical protein BHM03_00020694 [Ensete ventricosum]